MPLCLTSYFARGHQTGSVGQQKLPLAVQRSNGPEPAEGSVGILPASRGRGPATAEIAAANVSFLVLARNANAARALAGRARASASSVPPASAATEALRAQSVPPRRMLTSDAQVPRANHICVLLFQKRCYLSSSVIMILCDKNRMTFEWP